MLLSDRRRRLRRQQLEQAPAPWLTPGKRQLAELILSSHAQAFGRSLAPSAQELFSADLVVLAHDGSSDPCLTYANAAAWPQGCPSGSLRHQSRAFWI